jgi:hypothetical protein
MPTLRPLKHVVRPDGVTLHRNSQILAVQAQLVMSHNDPEQWRMTAGHDLRSGVEADLDGIAPCDAPDAQSAVAWFESQGYRQVAVEPVPGAATGQRGITVLWELVDVAAQDSRDCVKARVVLLATGQAVDQADLDGLTYLGTVQYVGVVPAPVVHVFVDLAASGSTVVTNPLAKVDAALAGLMHEVDRKAAAVKASALTAVEAAATAVGRRVQAMRNRDGQAHGARSDDDPK